jgi:NAD(P)H-hydrate epimerase
VKDLTNEPLPKLPDRQVHSHKGNYGRALLVGGSVGMAGAMALAGKSTLRSGAGLVTLAIPEMIQEIVAGFDPCYMTLGLVGSDDGFLGPISLLELPEEVLEKTDVFALGPGLRCNEETRRVVERLYRTIAKPMVVDADGLNCLAHYPELLANPPGPRILTPHPGEFMRLALAVDPDWDTALEARSGDAHHRQRAAAWLASHDPSEQTTIVLKGAGTVIAQTGQVATNRTGNPGMATGGSGDVLTGVITGLLCQAITPWEAARLGTHVHGLAGDLGANQLGQISLLASDLVEFLPVAFQSCQPGEENP